MNCAVQRLGHRPSNSALLSGGIAAEAARLQGRLQHIVEVGGIAKLYKKAQHDLQVRVGPRAIGLQGHFVACTAECLWRALHVRICCAQRDLRLCTRHGGAPTQSRAASPSFNRFKIRLMIQFAYTSSVKATRASAFTLGLASAHLGRTNHRNQGNSQCGATGMRHALECSFE